MKKPPFPALSIAGVIMGFVLVFVALFIFNRDFREQVRKRLVYNVTMTYGTQFHDALATSTDRIVIRDGGYDCCRPIDGDRIIADIKDKKEIADFFKNIVFSAHTTSNSQDEVCMCCGYPGIDFYQGNSRLAITSVQHFKNLRWKGFSTLRFAGWTIYYGDAPMTPAAGIWLKDFLKRHNVRVSEPAEDEEAPSTEEGAPATTESFG